jgi:hypothetical protein
MRYAILSMLALALLAFSPAPASAKSVSDYGITGTHITMILNWFSGPEAKTQLTKSPSKSFMAKMKASGTVAEKETAYFLPSELNKKLGKSPAGTGRVIVGSKMVVIDSKTGAPLAILPNIF